MTRKYHNSVTLSITFAKWVACSIRDLHEFELKHVSGAGCSPCPPTAPTKTKNGNNGFGNGADENLVAPGNAGATGGGRENSVGDDRGPR